MDFFFLDATSCTFFEHVSHLLVDSPNPERHYSAVVKDFWQHKFNYVFTIAVVVAVVIVVIVIYCTIKSKNVSHNNVTKINSSPLYLGALGWVPPSHSVGRRSFISLNVKSINYKS